MQNWPKDEKLAESDETPVNPLWWEEGMLLISHRFEQKRENKRVNNEPKPQ